ncbi:MAG: OmpH family outer membrane protein [Candidatus Hydrogenedentes bacterium]|nr:OmpH family outer membrane protein [Candidatus Hydrogenedentota bacterium]
MKRRIAVALGAAVVCVGLAAAVSVPRVSAQDEAAGKSAAKIAVINKKTVFDNYGQREAEWKALETDKENLQAEIDKLREQVNEGRKRLREDKTLTEQQRQELTDKVAAENRDYEDRWRRAQGEIDDKSNKFFDKILGQIDAGVREVGNAEGYKIIIDSDPKAGTPVLYFDPSLDITKKVTDHLNSK